MFHGSITALITPMQSDGSIDEAEFSRFVDWQIAEGTAAIVPCGTTGESPTLSHEEHERVVELAVAAARGRVPVIAGAGSNSTAEAIRLARHAGEAGADAVLVVTPYYNKPTQDGLFRHYSAIADAVDLPLIIYNIPGRSVIDMSVETMARLSRHRNIIGVKDATANLARPLQTARACGADFVQLSGEDHTALAFLASGGHGCISVTAKHRAPAVRRDAGRLGGGRSAPGDGDPGPAAAAARCDVRREQSGAGEIRGGVVGLRQRPLPAAAGAAGRGDGGQGAGGDGGSRAAELSMSPTPSKSKSGYISHGVAAQNRKARFDYKILSTIEAGIVLKGVEVKSLGWAAPR